MKLLRLGAAVEIGRDELIDGRRQFEDENRDLAAVRPSIMTWRLGSQPTGERSIAATAFLGKFVDADCAVRIGTFTK